MFIYESNKILVFDSANGERTYNLDADGRIVKQGNFTFKYNNEGYLIESAEIRSDLKYIITYQYENGNLIGYKGLYEVQGRLTNESVTLSYNDESSQKMSALADTYPLGYLSHLGPYKGELLPLFGKGSKNLITKHTYKNDVVPIEQVITYSYNKDAMGKINSLDRYVSGKLDLKYKISYKCK